MKYFSTFSGIGGFELGIQQAYERRYLDLSRTKERKIQSKNEESMSDASSEDGDRRKQHPLCVGYSEIDKYAVQVYNKQFNHKNYGDITKIDTSKLPDFDLLVGGFPCQAFSIAGKRKGFDDTRGTLFFDLARILADKRPRNFVFENVKGLLSHDEGKTFQTILGVLSDLGYRVEWQVLNSKWFGVPQNRERVFIVGHLGKGSGREIFPIGEDDKLFDEQTRENNKQTSDTKNQIARTINSRLHKMGDADNYVIKQLNNPTHSNDRVYSEKGLSPTLNTMQGGKRQPFIKMDKKGRLKKDQKNASCLTGGGHSGGNHSDMDLIKAVLTPDRPNKRQMGRRMKENGEPSFTVTAQDRHGIYNGSRIRRLTPVECERLQGFPDNWTKYGMIKNRIDLGYKQSSDRQVEISDTQRYKMCGNAITTNVVKEVISRLFDSKS